MVRLRSPAPILATLLSGRFPERPKGADCKSVVTDFAGPNPASPITKKTPTRVSFLLSGDADSKQILTSSEIWFVHLPKAVVSLLA